MTDDELNQLEKLARGATPGPWWCDSGNGSVESRHSHHYRIEVCERVDLTRRVEDYKPQSGEMSHPDDDLEYIAAVGPNVVLQLINMIRRYKESVRRLNELSFD